jgi:hypothetical protein
MTVESQISIKPESEPLVHLCRTEADSTVLTLELTSGQLSPPVVIANEDLTEALSRLGLFEPQAQPERVAVLGFESSPGLEVYEDGE